MIFKLFYSNLETTYLYQCCNYLFEHIYQSSQNLDLDTILKCVNYLKTTSKTSVMTSLRNWYPEIVYQDKIKVLELNGLKGSKVSSNSFPQSHFQNNINDLKNLNINKILKPFQSKVNDIFGIEFKNNIIHSNSQSDSIMIASHGDYKYHEVKILKLYNLVCLNNKPWSNKSYHEMFKEDKQYWLFFDIDCNDPSKIIDIESILKQIKKLLTRPVAQHLCDVFKCFAVQCNSGAQKYRIFTNLSMKLEQMKFIATQLYIPEVDL